LVEKGLTKDLDPGRPTLFSPVFNAYVLNAVRELAGQTPRGIMCDVRIGEIWVDGAINEKLSPVQKRVVKLLYRKRGTTCSYAEIATAAYPRELFADTDANRDRIQMVIQRIRKKIKDPPGEDGYIKTVRSEGYRLVRFYEPE
jgi:DNA-binding response OmpR family regulator